MKTEQELLPSENIPHAEPPSVSDTSSRVDGQSPAPVAEKQPEDRGPSIRPTSVSAQFIDDSNIVVTFSLHKTEVEHLMRRILFERKKTLECEKKINRSNASPGRSTMTLIRACTLLFLCLYLIPFKKLSSWLGSSWWTDDALTF